MIKNKIGKIFDFISETNLTEENFYEMQGDYPVYSGQTLNNGVVASINTFNQKSPCITFTTYGSAGKLSYREGDFTVGRNCMGLRPKEEYQEKIILEWFSYKFQNLFFKLTIGDPNGQRSLNKLILENVEMIIPDKEVQEKELELYKSLKKLINDMNKINLDIDNLNKDNQEINTVKNKDRLDKIFKMVGGNSGLTEEFIYYNSPSNNEEKIAILSSATLENTFMGFISRNAQLNKEKIKIFNTPCILIARNGYAGTMTYMDKGEFTTNDHAYILTIRDEWKDKLNIRWFIYQYQGLFYNLVTSKSDNATFNKEYAEAQIIKLPNKEVQDKIAEKLILIDDIRKQINLLTEKASELIEYEIVK